MSETTALLVVVVVTALGFDFTNGLHDPANAMATTIATGRAEAADCRDVARRGSPSAHER